MKIFGLHILTEDGIKAELKKRNDFDESQLKFLLRDNLKLRGIIVNLQDRYRKYLKRAYDAKGNYVIAKSKKANIYSF